MPSCASVYAYSQRRLDEALNVVDFYVPQVGMYPIPIPHYRIIPGQKFGKQEREIDSISSVETAYSIPFSKQAIEKIKAISLADRVSYTITTPNGLRTQVQTFQDLRDGEFSELLQFTRIPTEAQRRRWLEDNGKEGDLAMEQEILRKRTELDVPQRNVTAEEVRQIIKQETKPKEKEEPITSTKQKRTSRK
jgi:hypothetical protein